MSAMLDSSEEHRHIRHIEVSLEYSKRFVLRCSAARARILRMATIPRRK